MESEFNSNGSTDPAYKPWPKPSDGKHFGRHFPPVRRGQVERARALLADASYPPDELLNRIANLFARHLK
jgi:hypothetical protein